MNLTPYELERARHIETRRALLQAQGAVIDRDAAALEGEIRARLRIEGAFSITSDGIVTPVGEVERLRPAEAAE